MSISNSKQHHFVIYIDAVFFFYSEEEVNLSKVSENI